MDSLRCWCSTSNLNVFIYVLKSVSSQMQVGYISQYLKSDRIFVLQKSIEEVFWQLGVSFCKIGLQTTSA